MNTAAIERALDELHDLLGGDDVRFELEAEASHDARLRVRLDLSAVDCVECVLPADVLAEMVTDTMRRQLDDPTVVVEVDDPRVTADAP